MLPEDTLKHYFNYRETPAPNTKHQSPITKRFEFDSGADFFRCSLDFFRFGLSGFVNVTTAHQRGVMRGTQVRVIYLNRM
jgi:hypothetical protein